jgi:diamine N-acetyltransferase
MKQSLPFTRDVYQLNADVVLRTDTTDAAVQLGQRLAQMEPWQSLGFNATSLTDYLSRSDPGLHRYRICHLGAVCGVVAVREPWLRGAYLELLALFAERQGQGIGQQIIRWLSAETAIRSNNLWTTVAAHNQPARRFYAQQGFIAIADIPDLIQPGTHETLLRLPLSRCVSPPS